MSHCRLAGLRVIQFVPQIVRADAVSNEVWAVHEHCRSVGMESAVCCFRAASEFHGRVSGPEILRSSWDFVLLHFSHGLAQGLSIVPGTRRTIVFYHGITPASFFASTNRAMARASEKAFDQLCELGRQGFSAVAKSEFAARDLRSAGFQKTIVVPYIFHESMWSVEPDQALETALRQDPKVTVLTVGRICPHKCLEDILLTFDYYQRFIHRNSRLFIVGASEGTEAYKNRLQRLVKRLGTADVVFTGVVSQAELLAYYRAADCYICMSEHEGFCAPLVEAMWAGTPILAYAAGAVKETLRGAGLLFEKKDWAAIASAAAVLIEDRKAREEVLRRQNAVASYYSPDAARARLLDLLGDGSDVSEMAGRTVL